MEERGDGGRQPSGQRLIQGAPIRRHFRQSALGNHIEGNKPRDFPVRWRSLGLVADEQRMSSRCYRTTSSVGTIWSAELCCATWATGGCANPAHVLTRHRELTWLSWRRKDTASAQCVDGAGPIRLPSPPLVLSRPLSSPIVLPSPRPQRLDTDGRPP